MPSLILDAKQLIKNANENIETNIEVLCPEHYGLCAQNILSQLRNLLDGVFLLQYRLDFPSINANNGRDEVLIAKNHLSNKGKEFEPFRKLYSNLEVIASHYTQNIFNSEVLLLKYVDLMYDIRDAAKSIFGLCILRNLESFPFSDGREEEYYKTIKDLIDNIGLENESSGNTYYIESKIRRKFGVYEYVLSPANDKRTKFDRLTAFSLKNLGDKNSLECRFVKKKISYRGISIVVPILTSWSVSIRPCEINKLSLIEGVPLKIERGTSGYVPLMTFLTKNNISLYDFVVSKDFKKNIEELNLNGNNKIISFLKRTKEMIESNIVGSRTIRYLLYMCRHEIIKHQISDDPLKCLGTTMLSNGCYAFESHPYSFSLLKHNPNIYDLLSCLPACCTNEELLKRTLVSNTEDKKKLYTPICDLDKVFCTTELAEQFNRYLVEKTKGATIEFYNKYAYIRSYEEHTISILKKLIEKSHNSDPNYFGLSESYVDALQPGVIDNEKVEILKKSFSNSSVVLINGAAGTGKTTLIKHYSNIFVGKKVLFLSWTNSSVQNLRIKVGKESKRDFYDFMTIEKYIKKIQKNKDKAYSILVVDECSMVENDSFDFVINNRNFEKILLVGDERQIESIKFGNWFGIANVLLSCHYELSYTHRTSDPNLKFIWGLVRELKEKDKIVEKIINANYLRELDNSVFDSSLEDEVVLCLNYDGVYGINNINRYMQEQNNGQSVSWKVWTFKVGDRILFNESYHFRNYFYNNQKGWITDIKENGSNIEFFVKVEHEDTNLQEWSDHIIWIKEENNFDFYRITIDKDDDDDEENNSRKILVVPFQLGYAISIHKSQGLEYDSVKVVFTKETQEQISHNIFYTAITRAKKKLALYCDKESLNHIVESFERQDHIADAKIIKAKFGL